MIKKDYVMTMIIVIQKFDASWSRQWLAFGGQPISIQLK
jgi:hypothetical protein